MCGGNKAAGDDAHLLRMPAEPHRHQRRLVCDLEPLDLEVVLGMPKAGVACLVRDLSVLGDLVQHALIEV